MNLAIIPARGGSKGLPGKNIRELCGKPLIAWSIEAAKKSKKLDRIVVSTDSEDIANVSRQFDCEVLMRPSQLATDESTTISLVTHIATEIPEAKNFVVLQPTSPLRKDHLIDDCFLEFEKDKFSNLATGYYCKFQEFGTHNNVRRQDYKGFFYDDGNVYILSRDIVRKGMWFGQNICKYEIEKYQNFEIDDEVDFFILEALIKKYKL
jgi:CMP-N-acetylneuraminic acid synthetase